VIVFTTPNREFNKFFNLEQGKFRHWDHKFEFDTEEFVVFCDRVALDVYNYTLISIPFPDIERLVKQYKHTRAAMEGVTATFMAVFTLKQRSQQLCRVDGRIMVPFIKPPTCMFSFKDFIKPPPA
jgi:hypothetical protein